MIRGDAVALIAVTLFALPQAGAPQEGGRAEVDAATSQVERSTAASAAPAEDAGRTGAESAEAARTRLSGEELFLACAGCHSLDPANMELVGPHLAGIVGREAAAVAGYPYSQALADASFVWERGVLFSWIVAAESLVPGTHMLYQNHLEADEVYRLIDFLRSSSRFGSVER